jgi:hypothetical protein
MSATTVTPSRTGQLVELGRYATDIREQRVIVGRRVDGVVRVFDLPVDGRGRSYQVESGFESYRELAALVADYKRQALRLGEWPMTRRALRRLAEIESLQVALP